ncbi:MAG: PqqD family peptide modification chaperone, partial [Leifsonia sp.]
GGGFGRAITLDTALAALIGACDGELSVGAICAALAQLLEVDETALSADLLPAVRELVLDGVLSPSSSSRG